MYKPNEWNHLSVVCDGDHFVITLNDQPLLDTKQKGPKTGRIGFQIAKGKEFAEMEYRFKNIKLTPIPAAK
jgi:hypothetical protein